MHRTQVVNRGAPQICTLPARLLPGRRDSNPYLRGGPRRHPPGRPGDPRPACAPPAAPAPPPPPPAPQLPAARCAQRPDAEGSERPNRTGSGEGAGEEGGGSFLLPGGAGGFLSSFSPGTRARTYTRGHTRARALGRAGLVGRQLVSRTSESLLFTLALCWPRTRGEVRWGERAFGEEETERPS